MVFPKALAATACIALLAGCVTTQTHELETKVDPIQLEEFLADKPAPLRRLYARIPIEGPRNAVLNHTRTGLAALEIDEIAHAAASFDRALESIDAIYADNPRAAAARSLWIKENIKDFKGEPYERAMAYYYRGLAYMRSGEYDNAAASFRGAIFQDSIAAEETYRSDFAAMLFLEGWARRCYGNAVDARDAFAEAARHQPRLAEPPASHTVLLLAETGRGPLKAAEGAGRERLVFRRSGNIREQGVNSSVDGVKVPGIPAGDVFYQATTRGGRPIDAILANKAVWKGATDTTGSVLVGAGVLAATYGASSGDRDTALAGLGIAALGLLVQGVAAQMQAEADVRSWDNLPDRIHVATLESIPPTSKVVAEWLDETQSPLADTPAQIRLEKVGNCSLGWIRSVSALWVPDVAPNAIMRQRR